MKTKLLALLFLVGTSSMFARTHFSIGIGVGGYGPGYYAPRYYAPAYYAPPVVAYRAPYPGSGYNWVSGYWYTAGPRRLWREGYWAPPVYVRPYRVGPRYYGRRYGYGYRRGY